MAGPKPNRACLGGAHPSPAPRRSEAAPSPPARRRSATDSCSGRRSPWTRAQGACARFRSGSVPPGSGHHASAPEACRPDLDIHASAPEACRALGPRGARRRAVQLRSANAGFPELTKHGARPNASSMGVRGESPDGSSSAMGPTHRLPTDLSTRVARRPPRAQSNDTWALDNVPNPPQCPTAIWVILLINDHLGAPWPHRARRSNSHRRDTRADGTPASLRGHRVE